MTGVQTCALPISRLVIVLLPGRVIAPASHASMREAANDGVIEGEFHEIKDEPPKLR